MKKLFILLISICAGVIQAQDTLAIEKSSYVDNINNISMRIQNSDEYSEYSDFSIIHPRYGNGLLSWDNIAQYIINEYELTSQSSDLEIVLACASFNKTNDLQINSSVTGIFDQRNSPLWAYWSFYSTQCGEHRTRTCNTIMRVCGFLNRDTPLLRTVSWEGHQTMEWFDSVYEKWLHIDPDPGTMILLCTDGNGGYASAEEMISNFELILDSNTILAQEMIHDGDTERDYGFYLDREYESWINFIEDHNVSSLNYWPPDTITDDREIYFRVHDNSIIEFTPPLKKRFHLDISMFNIEYVINCFNFPGENEEEQLENFNICIDTLALENNVTSDSLWAMLDSDSVVVDVNKDGLLKIYGNDNEFITVYLEPGSYNPDNFRIPLAMRSAKSIVDGGMFTINDQLHVDTFFVQAYIPSGSTETLETATEQIHESGYIYIPEASGGLVLTFYFNYRMFNFLEFDHSLILGGDIKVTETVSLYETNQDTTDISEPLSLYQHDITNIQVYPNPAHQTLFISKEAHMKLHSIDGKMVAEKYGTSLDVSYLSKGMYILHIHEDNEIFTSHKVIVN